MHICELISTLYLLPSEMEMAKARNQLDAVLQCLLEKSHMDRLGSAPAWGTARVGIVDCVWTLCGWDLDGRLEADTERKVFPGETHYYHTLGPQYPKPMVLFASRERLDEDAGKTPSDTHNK